jgi:hypothetical protein
MFAEQAEVVRPDCRLRAIGYTQLGENIAYMTFDGLNCQRQGQRNLGIGCALFCASL